MEPTTMAMDPMTTEQATGFMAKLAALGAVGAIIGLAIGIVGIIASWKIYSKAGQPGWAIFIPIYNAICGCKVIGKPGWWWLLGLIPIYGQIVIPIIAIIRLAKAFGKGVGFGIMLLIPGLNFIMMLVLAFSADYVGFPEEAAAPAAAAPAA